jgi:hypothetical protein
MNMNLEKKREPCSQGMNRNVRTVYANVLNGFKKTRVANSTGEPLVLVGFWKSASGNTAEILDKGGSLQLSLLS